MEEPESKSIDYDKEFVRVFKQTSSSLLILTGTTLVAVLGFTGSVWSRQHSDLFDQCADAIK
jgi:hypothetical protein